MKKYFLTFTYLFLVTIACAQVHDSLQTPGTAITGSITDAQVELPVITLNEDDDETGTATVSSVLSAGRNPFLSTVAYNFSVTRFRLRGYPNGDAIYLNGIDFTGLDNGFIPFSLWSGLTNIMRARQNAYGLEPAAFAFGNIGLNTNIDMRAGAQWAQTQLGYGLTNRNYRHRIFLSQASGFNKKGWAYSYMLNARYAHEGYVPGTWFRGVSYYASADKKLNRKSVVSLIAFGAPTENGRQAASVQEAMDLVGTNFYNPSWGWQNGTKRNSNVAATVQPVFMTAFEYKPRTNSSWMTTAAYVFGKRKLSGFDWYNTADPRPDYYRYLPGYYSTSDPPKADAVRAAIAADPLLLQVNWEQLYEANRYNRATIQNVNGTIGNNISGNRSVYILSNRVNNLRRYIINTVYHTQLQELISFSAGAHYQQQRNQYYLEVNDLLGGDFWVNVNQFAERDDPNNPNTQQYDIDIPDQLKKKGDRYGYHYKMTVNNAAAWVQLQCALRKLDWFVSGKLMYTAFYRTGLNRNGLFPDDSYGEAPHQQFTNASIKSGITYKLNGRNYLYANAGYYSRPPYFDNVYQSPRTRSTLQTDVLSSERTIATEAGYKLNCPRIKLSIAGFYTSNKDAYDILSFYHDQYQSFVNDALSGINTVYFGGELGAEIRLTATLTLNTAAAAGRYYYDSRPLAIITADNTAKLLATQTVYIQNYRVPATPQNAYSTGLFYRSPRYWYISLTGNYFSNTWLNINPVRRTITALGDADPAQTDIQQTIHNILVQERFKDQYTLDFFGGWTKRLQRKYRKPAYLVFNLGINNLLNNKNIRSGGFEQLRFDVKSQDAATFPPKYYYAYGLNYYAGISFRFN